MTSLQNSLVSASLWGFCAYVFHDQLGWPQVIYAISLVGVGINLGVAMANYNKVQGASANTSRMGVR